MLSPKYFKNLYSDLNSFFMEACSLSVYGLSPKYGCLSADADAEVEADCWFGAILTFDLLDELDLRGGGIVGCGDLR